MFERFTPEARRVMVQSQHEANSLNHGFIGTEHLLLALFIDPDCLSARLLAAEGLTKAKTLTFLRVLPTPINRRMPSPPFTPRAKRVLEIAFRESLQLGHVAIGPEHLLLGMLREVTDPRSGDRESVFQQIFISNGIDAKKLRMELITEPTFRGLESLYATPVSQSLRVSEPAIVVSVSEELRTNFLAKYHQLVGAGMGHINGLSHVAELLPGEVSMSLRLWEFVLLSIEQLESLFPTMPLDHPFRLFKAAIVDTIAKDRQAQVEQLESRRSTMTQS